MPIKEVYRPFLHAEQYFWNDLTGFADGACGVIQAAADLEMNVAVFIDAFSQVDIYLEYDASTRICTILQEYQRKFLVLNSFTV